MSCFAIQIESPHVNEEFLDHESKEISERIFAFQTYFEQTHIENNFAQIQHYGERFANVRKKTQQNPDKLMARYLKEKIHNENC